MRKLLSGTKDLMVLSDALQKKKENSITEHLQAGIKPQRLLILGYCVKEVDDLSVDFANF